MILIVVVLDFECGDEEEDEYDQREIGRLHNRMVAWTLADLARHAVSKNVRRLWKTCGA